MNNRLIKVLCLILLIFLSTINVKALSLPKEVNEETGYSILLEDDANLLSEEELHKLQKEMQPLTEYGNIVFKTISENPSTSVSYASSYYYERFGNESGTLFLIDMDNRYIYIYSAGENYNVVTTAKANIITDNAYQYASDRDYYKCASVAFSQINTILNGGKIAEPMRYISNILIALTLAFFINFFIILVSTSAKKASIKEILSNAMVNFDVSNIRVHKTGTRRVYSPRSSSSGGGSSGGGGGSSGGGGGHRF